MRKFIILVLFFFCQNILCQEYHFDKAILFTETIVKANNTQYLSLLINSKNPSYYFISSSWGDELNCALVDNNTNISHRYSLKSLKNDTDFTYESSWKRTPENKEVNCEKFMVNEIKLDSLYTKIEAINYYTKKKKRIDSHYSFTVKPIDFPILNTIINIVEHNHELDCIKLSISQNHIPSLIEFKRNNVLRFKYNLISIKDIDTTFTVKQEDIIFN